MRGDGISTFTVEAFIRVEWDVRTVREYQVIQTALDRVQLKLVTTPEFTHRDGERLRRRFEAFLGPGVTVEVAEVDDIPLEPSGKRLAVKTEVPA
jgi:hypothetical protein